MCVAASHPTPGDAAGLTWPSVMYAGHQMHIDT